MQASPDSGPGIYFDGVTSARHDVVVTLCADTLRISDRDGVPLAEWPYGEIIEISGPESILRLGRTRSTALERLEIRDTIFAAKIDQYSAYVDRSGALQRRERERVIGWSLGATLSLIMVAYFGIPVIAARLTPILSATVERKLGDAVDLQVRGTLDSHKLGAAFACGAGTDERRGYAALGKIMKRLEDAASLPFHLQTVVVRRDEANAIALPGGRIYVFQGLIDKVANADELAGVIAHEIGHVAHRDGTKAVLEGAGLSFLFGMLLGDFVGGGAVVFAAKSVLQSSYTREAEASADAYGAELMNKVGGDAHALAAILDRIGGATEPGMKILLNHPETRARVEAINRIAANGRTVPFLDVGEWSALKQICRGT